ncbi:MAG: 23S rRNA (adenine(2503)-C(2))-methyltransferase RlmN [Candidatus Marinimicrobia bacterium]|nr:23S rRNA (adenine(2503)-C(2))-methyltransferase RlmN [Candidatus Neomarinimicrobiota bacterium]
MVYKQSLKNLLPEEIEAWVLSKGYPAYRGRQLAEWLYGKKVEGPQAMYTLPQSLRDLIQQEGNLFLTQLVNDIPTSFADSQKFLFKLTDGEAIESVYLPSKNRRTVCVSSQVGCALKCSFCQTARMGFHRNLSAGEIVDQVLQISRWNPENITNVVFMGMGEPFHNFESVAQAAKIMNHPKGLHISARHITVSTAGLVPGIYAFAELPYPFKLAVSLNAIRDDLRDVLMPINKQYPLTDLLKAVKFYTQKTHRRVTFEYVLLKDVTMTIKDADILVSRLKDLNCKVNLIPYNMTHAPYQMPDEEEILAFADYLQSRASFPVTIRWSGGRDKQAACGQLYTETKREEYA